MLNKIVGYLAVSPSDSNQMGLLYRNEQSAKDHAVMMDALVEELWDDPASTFWNKSYWSEKPSPWKIYALVVSEEIIR